MGFSAELELLKVLETLFNFRSNLIDEQRNWGINQGNGTWTGSVGSVLKKVLKYLLLLANCTIEFE